MVWKADKLSVEAKGGCGKKLKDSCGVLDLHFLIVLRERQIDIG